MQIAIVGAGRIGSTFAFHLARGGHQVTLIARGKRLEELQREPAVVSVKGERAPVTAAGTLEPATPFDLVLVTVLAQQVDPLLPALQASAAKKVMFMFNTVEPLGRLRDAVGAARFEFAFPTVTAWFVDGRLKSSVAGPGKVTTVTSDEWAKVFSQAGIPSEVHPDMESFLRSHAAFVIPLMAIGCAVHARGAGLSWAEARRYTRVMGEGFEVVRHTGHRITPSMVVFLSRLPAGVLTGLLWFASRLAAVRVLGEMGPNEVRALIDGMSGLAQGKTPEMLALKP